MSTTIIDFWKANRRFWIPITNAEKAEADAVITERFLEYDYRDDNIYGQVVFLDQFLRHFERHMHKTNPTLVDEDTIQSAREIAVDIVKANMPLLETADEIELLFCLMPFKHLNQYDFIFPFIHTVWLKGRPLTDFPHLSKFYNDTYKKAYTLDSVYNAIKHIHAPTPYDPVQICDSYPDEYNAKDWLSRIYEYSNEAVLSLLRINRPVIVSLSGGVDSMVMLALLTRLSLPTVAVHIMYGNRKESPQEYAFIAEYCKKLNIPLYTYTIEFLRRDTVDRAFYESMTRDLRFFTYEAVKELSFQEGQEPVVCLGHIQDDVVENIWTNLAKGQHLHNLKKMAQEERQQRVVVYRPFLTLEKSTIYEVSQQLAIPYLKNTTPAWSNRGKFREHFYKATHDQFGDAVDRKMIQVADMLEKQAAMIERLLYYPILQSYKDRVINITPAVHAQMDEAGWVLIFEHICHKHLGLGKPSIHAIRDFCGRLARFERDPIDTMIIPMKKEFAVILRHKEKQYTLEFRI